MHTLSLPIVTTYAISIAFGIVGVLQFAGVGIVRRSYFRWGYHTHVFRITGALELLAALLLLTSSAHSTGVVCAAVINFITVVLLLGNSAYVLALPGLAIMAVLPLTLIPTH